MSRYRYGHRPGKHRPRKALLVIIIVISIVGLGAGLIVVDMIRNSNNNAQVVEGAERTIKQAEDTPQRKLKVEEPTFSMELPAGWKQISRVNSTNEKSVSWETASKSSNSENITVYVDLIPPNIALNRILPVTSQENKIIASGNMSENCATFTTGGTLDAQKAQLLRPTPAKYQKVDFICDLANVIENKVGTGSLEGVNVITVKGQNEGTHKYFFVFTEHSIQPQYNILTDALESFRAK